MRTHIAAYGPDDEVIYEPPHHVLGVEVIGDQCFLMLFDWTDTAGADVDMADADSRYVQAIVRPGTLMRALRLHITAEHVRTSRIPALGDADSYDEPSREVLVLTVIGEAAYLDLHPADPDLGRPIYPPRGTIRVPAADLVHTLKTQIEDDAALREEASCSIDRQAMPDDVDL